MFMFLVWQSTRQSVSNHNQNHFSNSAQKDMHIHNMFPRFLEFCYESFDPSGECTFSKLYMICTVCSSRINYPCINVYYEKEKLWGENITLPPLALRLYYVHKNIDLSFSHCPLLCSTIVLLCIIVYTKPQVSVFLE